ncbi:DUF2066 domain-containing protein [Neptuniibacter halophilus]|uniref:DUF2066 domain-containing protein n=1 Tax=Neptuniibacter halophilus TaxID=651666 RepID=UPI0025741786|nr:DUF2066 domain-containing protein [Neptuniibacter halophilus]
MDLMRTFFTALLIILSLPLNAATVTDLYRATLPVSQQSAAPDQAALQQGLRQVLVKVSGNKALLGNPLIQSQLSAAPGFLQQFSYQGTVDAQKLVLDFSPAAVNELLSRSGFKPLGESRPAVLVWLATELQGERDFVLAEDSLQDQLSDKAALRGLPLQFPLLDLTDQAALPVSDLWGLFAEPVAQASKRYRPDAVVAGRITPTPAGKVQLDWSLSGSSDPQRFSSTGTLDEVLTELVETTADQILQPVVTHGLSYYQKGIAVRVSNVNSLAAYIQLNDFLKSLPVVREVNTERARGSDLVLRVQLDGSEARLQQAISVDQRLQPADLIANPDGSRSLSYRWQE